MDEYMCTLDKRNFSTELEKLSPFIGDETIPLNNEDFEGFYTLGFENFHDLEFPDEIFNFCANTEQLFQQVLIQS